MSLARSEVDLAEEAQLAHDLREAVFSERLLDAVEVGGEGGDVLARAAKVEVDEMAHDEGMVFEAASVVGQGGYTSRDGAARRGLVRSPLTWPNVQAVSA